MDWLAFNYALFDIDDFWMFVQFLLLFVHFLYLSSRQHRQQYRKPIRSNRIYALESIETLNVYFVVPFNVVVFLQLYKHCVDQGHWLNIQQCPNVLQVLITYYNTFTYIIPIRLHANKLHKKKNSQRLESRKTTKLSKLIRQYSICQSCARLPKNSE